MYATLIASLLLGANPVPPAPEAWLESELRRRSPEVTEWRIHEVRPSRASQEMQVERLELGPLGARTFVILHGQDGAGRRVAVRRWYEVAGFRPGLVMARPLGARTTITADMVTLSAVDVMAVPCSPLNDPIAAVGSRLLQSRHQGDTLCASMLGPAPPVARGGTVSVQVVAGAVSLTTEAVARADGFVGDRVPMYRSPDHGLFWGVVTAPGEVRVNE
jgi:flagella basal body P-ring formation protein FlgA